MPVNIIKCEEQILQLTPNVSIFNSTDHGFVDALKISVKEAVKYLCRTYVDWHNPEAYETEPKYYNKSESTFNSRDSPHAHRI